MTEIHDAEKNMLIDEDLVITEESYLNDAHLSAYLRYSLMPKYNFFEYIHSTSFSIQLRRTFSHEKMCSILHQVSTKPVIVLLSFVNKNHWCLFLIDNDYETILYYNSLHLHPHPDFINNIIRLANIVYGQKEWKKLEIQNLLQNNGWDCGVYALNMAEFYLIHRNRLSDELKNFRATAIETRQEIRRCIAHANALNAVRRNLKRKYKKIFNVGTIILIQGNDLLKRPPKFISESCSLFWFHLPL